MKTAVDIRNLHYTYPDGKIALHGVSFSIREGERIGLIGPNGSGKSTLLLHLNGILPDPLHAPHAVSIMERPLDKTSVGAIRRDVGLLFQDPDDQLFCPTVYEDVAFGPKQFGMQTAETRAMIQRALEQTDLLGFEDRSPHHLSGGEKRRVCLAGVLACEPKILALDEPTSNLDPRGKRKLKEILRSLQATQIIATHDLELVVELCSRTIVLDQGRIIADGDTIELLGNEALMFEHGLETPHILRHRHPH
jgi:energy-coupling factor transporter ATP-binding protein EcfA2